ncbi:hypothetical protein [Chromobacterium haemolyticum]|uniref:hypothetical protein n=1 Tax=Chromobacterium haemolyticum TaxID=394935 RepID=UPI0011B27418|nr:hypothetical protein [Chromobacterium haemolyticum]
MKISIRISNEKVRKRTSKTRQNPMVADKNRIKMFEKLAFISFKARFGRENGFFLYAGISLGSARGLPPVAWRGGSGKRGKTVKLRRRRDAAPRFASE